MERTSLGTLPGSSAPSRSSSEVVGVEMAVSPRRGRSRDLVLAAMAGRYWTAGARDSTAAAVVVVGGGEEGWGGVAGAT
jgi:hypothetical protein